MIITLQVLCFGFNCFSQTEFVLTPKGHTARINQVIYGANADEVLTVSDDKSLIIWNIPKGEPVKRYFSKLSEGNLGKIYSVALDNSNRFIAFGGNTILSESNKTNIIIIDRKEGSEIALPAHNSPITCLKFAKEGSYLVSAAEDSTIKVWNFTMEGVFTLKKTYVLSGKVLDLDLAMDRFAIAAVVGDNNVYLMEGFGNTSPLEKVISGVSKHFHPARCVAFSPDSAYLLSGGDDHLVNMYNSKGKFIKSLFSTSYGVTDIAFSYDAQNVVIANETSGLIEFVAVPSGKSISKYKDFNNTVQTLAFSPLSSIGNYEVIAAGGSNHELRLFSAINGKTLKILSNASHSFAHLLFKDEHTLAYNTDANEVNLSKELDLRTGLVSKAVGEKVAIDLELKKMSSFRINYNSIKWNGKIIVGQKEGLNRIVCLQKLPNQHVALGSDKGVSIYTEDAQKLKDISGLNSTVRTIVISPDNKWLAAAGDDQKICIWKLDSLGVPNEVPTYTYFVETNGEWILWNSAGYFCGSQNADLLLGWQIQKDSKITSKINELSSFSDALYRPDLIVGSFSKDGNLKQVLADKKESIIDLQALYRASPPVFKKPYFLASSGERRGLLEKSAEVFVTDTTEIILSVDVLYGGGGIEELNLLQNEKLLVIDKDFSLSNFKDKVTKEYKVRLLPGNNRFKVFTINKRKNKSPSDILNIECKATTSPISDLYILIVGINEYKNSKMNLNYGVPDAKAIADALKKNGSAIYNNVITTTLFNEQATLVNIKNSFNDIKSKCKLTDMFILYYAGHGLVYIDEKTDQSDFYMVLHDVTNMDSEQIKEKGLASQVLKEMLSDINANKQLVLMDACHSEASFKNNGVGRRGLAEQQAIYQLARSSGTVFIAACGTDQTAKEFKDLGHGAFTYAFLEALNGKADGGTMDKKITVNEIKAYIEDRVPELTEKYSGTAQYPSGYAVGQDFPLVVVK